MWGRGTLHIDKAVLVAGSGPAGARLAAELCRQGRHVLLVGRTGRTRPYLETLSSRARPLLGTLELAEARPCASNLAAWGGHETSERQGILRPWGHDWFVDRERFDAALVGIARTVGAELLSAPVTSVERASGHWTVGLQDGRRVHAGFLVDASGRASALGHRLGARRVRLDKLVGIPVRLERPAAVLQHSTLVASTPAGWWYAGPTPEGGACAIFFTDTDLPEYRAFRAPGGAARALDEVSALRDLCSGVDRLGAPFMATSEWLRPCAGDGWLAIGDAAASFDPLSSQGLYRSLLSAQLAAAAILGEQGTRAYRSRLQVDLLEYLAGRSAVYGREQRWASSPFWQRRAVAAPPLLSLPAAPQSPR